MRALVSIVALLLMVPSLSPAADQNPLIGNWRLISNHVAIDNGQPRDYPGPNPKGYLILTPEGRMMAFLASSDRAFGTSETEQAKLLRSMLAYSGKYRVEGSDFITAVDASWIQEWNGTEQRRHFSLQGDRLTIVSAPTPVPGEPGKTAIGTLIWEREK